VRSRTIGLRIDVTEPRLGPFKNSLNLSKTFRDTCVLGLVLSGSSFGQPYTISTFVGGGLPVNVPATAASLGRVSGVAVDPGSNLFLVSSDYNAVLRLDAATQGLSLFAGNGTPGFSGDNGPAVNAQFAAPPDIAVDAAGNLYIADSGNNRIRKVSNGIITTVVGTGASGFAGDGGPALGAILNNPRGISVDRAGNLYFSDSGNFRVRKVSNGVITTVAGTGTRGYTGDGGPATNAQLNAPGATAVDSAGNLYFVDSEFTVNVGSFTRLLKVSNGMLTSVVTGPFGELNTALALAADAAGNLFIADSAFHGVLELSNGLVTAVAGNGTSGFSGDGGPPTSAQLSESFGIAVDSTGALYIADSDNRRIRKVSGGVINTVAGNGSVSFSGDNSPPSSAQLNAPVGVALDPAGNLYFADTQNYRVRKVSNGLITTVAGNGIPGSSGDAGLAISAQLSPRAVAVDATGNLYIADSTHNVVRVVSNGVITTLAGNGTAGFSGDGGPATGAQLNAPSGIAVDAAGNVYIADTQNFRVRKISNGVITTFAGGGSALGDNGPPTNAQLNEPADVAVDAAGNVYIDDPFNGRIRKVSNGVITTVAGNGSAGISGDGGPATNAQVLPARIAVDSAGNLYLTDNSHVRKVSNGVITTVAGNGVSGFSGDGGPATSAQLNQPTGIAVDASGTVYFADSKNNRIRVMTPGAAPPALTIDTSGIVNGASFTPGAPLVPGSIATAFGNFPESSVTVAGNLPLPNNLAGLSVAVGNGMNAPLYAVSGGQVNFQVPWELSGPAQAPIAAIANGQTSAPQAMSLAPVAPGIFTVTEGGQQLGAILDNTTGLLADTTHPATSGTGILQIYATGLGAVTNQPATGAPAGSNPLSVTTATPTVIIGASPAQVLFSGLAPGLVGVYQVNVMVPPGFQCSGACYPVPVVLSIGGAVSNVVNIAVR